jgi:hypothetical protein
MGKLYFNYNINPRTFKLLWGGINIIRNNTKTKRKMLEFELPYHGNSIGEIE